MRSTTTMLPQLLALMAAATVSSAHLVTINKHVVPPSNDLPTAAAATTSSDPLPLIIWHGLGDRFDSDGLHSIGDLAATVHPNTSVYYIRTADTSDGDRTNTFLGDLNVYLDAVCDALQAEPSLLNPTTGELRPVDALGFSQGGQFLRGLLQRCAPLRIRSLVTFGSQHNGIVALKGCGAGDFVCKGAFALMRASMWTGYVQSHVVPAQYFRPVDPATGEAVEQYLEKSGWLADVNNERVEERKKVYAERLARLEKFVMVVWEEDSIVVPRESGWFAEVNATDGKVTHVRDRRLYKEDWLGLKKLDEKDGLVFLSIPGDHMHLNETMLVKTFKKYYGPAKKSGSKESDLQEAVIPEFSRQWNPRPFDPEHVPVLEEQTFLKVQQST